MPIVEAVGVASSSVQPDRAKRMEAAMAQAVTDAVSAGLSLTDDSDAIRERMLAAREAVKKELS